MVVVKNVKEVFVPKKDFIVVLEQRLGGKKVYLKGFSFINEVHHHTTEKREEAIKLTGDRAEDLIRLFNGNRLYKLAYVEKK